MEEGGNSGEREKKCLRRKKGRTRRDARRGRRGREATEDVKRLGEESKRSDGGCEEIRGRVQEKEKERGHKKTRTSAVGWNTHTQTPGTWTPDAGPQPPIAVQGGE